MLLKGEIAPDLRDVKPMVLVMAEKSPEVVVFYGGEDGVTAWGTPKSHVLNLSDVKPTVLVTTEKSPEVVVVCGGEDGVITWVTPKSHFSKM